MGATIQRGDRYILMSNGECERVFDHAIAVAEHHVETGIEREYLERFKQHRLGFFSGYDSDLDKLFPTMEERQFWVRCFRDAGKWLYEGRIENPSRNGVSPALWIYYVYAVSNLLEGGLALEFLDEDSVLSRKLYEQECVEYAIRHEQVMAQEAADQDAKKCWIVDYGVKRGIDVPAAFRRKKIGRFLVVRLDGAPPRLVGKSWKDKEQVVRYLTKTLKPQFGEELGKLVEVIDLDESVRLAWSEEGGLDVVGPLES